MLSSFHSGSVPSGFATDKKCKLFWHVSLKYMKIFVIFSPLSHSDPIGITIVVAIGSPVLLSEC